jgi:two-component system chemotaxis response regulator CheB
MICDDSATIRGAISRMLEADPGIHVVAKVSNGRLAIDELKRTKVDVLVLDIEMPMLDGLAALPLLLQVDPGLRIIMASTLTTRGAEIAMRALRLGAADYVPKPTSIGTATHERFRLELISKVKGLARSRHRTTSPALLARSATPVTRQTSVLPPKMLAIGSSTGGPQALFTLIQALGRSVGVPVILTQHMPATFTPILAEHITRLGGMPCAEAEDGEPLLTGHIYLAPGDKHLIIERDGGAREGPGGAPKGARWGGRVALPKGIPGSLMARARLSTDPPENYCRPSVDPMLRSATTVCDGRVLVAMLTGMGHDGLAGTRCVVEAGGAAVAQDEATSVVWGMPGAVAQAGLCHAVLPLTKIAAKLLEMLRGPAR